MKIWSKLFLVAATGMMMFSSCLENIEPEGIADLRGAKAELLRAETALVEAKAARENAEAAIALAKAKVEEAIAKQEEAKAAYEAAVARLWELEAEKKEAMNAIELEQAMAEAKAAIALAEKQAAVYAAELERALMLIQADVVKAQIEYEKALKNLELAKNGLTTKQKNYLESYFTEVTNWQTLVDDLSTLLSNYEITLKFAIQTLDENKASAMTIRNLEKAVISAEATVEAAQMVADLIKEAMTLDPKVTDWAAEKDELQAQKDSLDLAWDEFTAENAVAKEEYGQKMADVNKAIADYSAATGYSFNTETGEFSAIPGTATSSIKVPEIYVAGPVDDEDKKMFTSDKLTNGDVKLQNKTFQYGKSEEFVKTNFDDVIEDIEAENTPEAAQANIKNYTTQIARLEADVFYQAQVEKYNDAVAAYESGKVVEYFTKYDEDFNLAEDMEAFNEAVKEFETALEAYTAEWTKHNPEADPDETDAIKAKYDTRVDEARLKYVVKRQASQDKRDSAEVVYAAAKLAFERAGRTYDDALAGAYAATGLNSVAAIETAIADYKADAETNKGNAEWDKDGKLAAANAINEEQLGKIKEAQKIFDDGDDKTATDAAGVWAKAGKDNEEAEATYQKELADAKKEFDEEELAARRERDDAINDIVTVPSTVFDPEYRTYLEGKVNTAKEDIDDALSAVKSDAKINSTSVNVAYEWPEGAAISFNVPEYLAKQTLEGYVFVEGKVENAVDVEYFKKVEVASLAREFTTITVVWNYYADLDGTDTDSDGQYEYVYLPIQFTYSWNIYYPGFPLVLPELEWMLDKQGDYFEAVNNDKEELFKSEYPNALISYSNFGGFITANNVQIANKESLIEVQETKIANLAQLPDFIAAIEAAKEEFVAFAAEAEAEIDALREFVEAEYPTYLALTNDFTDAQTEYTAKSTVVTAAISKLNELINKYVDKVPVPVWDETTNEWTEGNVTVTDGDIEAFVAALEEAYADAVLAVGDYQAKLEDAKTDLEKAKAGNYDGNEDNYNAVKTAQAAYDSCAAQLEYALSRLAEATEALKDAMEAIGAVEPEAEETPAE